MYPVYGQPLSDATGLVNRFDVETGGRIFEVEIVANFDVSTLEFDKDEKKLTLHIVSGLENNLAEIIIPLNLLSGNLTFYLNDQVYSPLIHSNKKISFVTLNFTGSGDNKLDIFGTTYPSDLTEKIEKNITVPELAFSRDPDYGLIYAVNIGILLIIGSIAGIIIFKIKRKRK